MTSGWVINGFELPIAPSSERKKVNRSFQSQSIYKFFPAVFKPSTVSYDYTITGYLYPEELVVQLEQLARSADTEIVSIVAFGKTVIGNGLYAIKQAEFYRDKPSFVDWNGFIHYAYRYTMTFTEFADQGENQSSIEGETDFDEDGVGLGGLAGLVPEFTGEQYDLDTFDPIQLLGNIGAGVLGL